MDSFATIEAMLFNLKEVVKDTDAVELKAQIDERIDDKSTDIVFIQEMANALSESFAKRERQMLTDVQITAKINAKIDGFRKEHTLKMDGLISSLMRDVDEAVDEYAKEVVRGLDPKTIKERFEKKEDFELWLTTKNNHYRNIMEKTVDRRTQSTLRSYLIDVEDVFETAVSYLNDREQIMAIEDPFYGSLAQSRALITRDTRNSIGELVVYNKGLYQASEDLFNELWDERKKFDAKKNATTASAAAVGGGTVGVAAVAGISAATGAATLTAAPIVAGVAAVIISGIIIAKIASKLSDSLYSSALEKNTQTCIDEFLREIDKSKLSMQTHLNESITTIFESELKSLDTTFLDFRKATYIDEQRIPKLAEKLASVEKAAEAAAKEGEVVAV